MERIDLRDAFIRWQGITREQFTIATSVVLGLAITALGYLSSSLLDEKVVQVKFLQAGALASLAISAAAGIVLVVNRLLDFRLTTELVKLRKDGAAAVERDKLEKRTDSLGDWSWRFFWLQIWAFFAGVLFFILFVFEVILPKLSMASGF